MTGNHVMMMIMMMMKANSPFMFKVNLVPVAQLEFFVCGQRVRLTALLALLEVPPLLPHPVLPPLLAAPQRCCIEAKPTTTVN